MFQKRLRQQESMPKTRNRSKFSNSQNDEYEHNYSNNYNGVGYFEMLQRLYTTETTDTGEMKPMALQSA